MIGGPPGVRRKIFLGFITRSRSQRDRLEGAKELKRLVFYSNIVVAPLLEDCNVSTGTCVLPAHKVPATSLSPLRPMLSSFQVAVYTALACNVFTHII